MGILMNPNTCNEPPLMDPKTNWLSYHFEHAKLQGIGGPGAPHSIRLERIGSTGDRKYYV